MRLDHVLIAAPPGCEQQARRFYGELLGLTEVPRPALLQGAEGVWFAINAGQQVHIGADQRFAPARKAHPSLALDGDALNALAARLEAAGVDVTWDERIPDVPRFYVHDPWGNRLEIRAEDPPG